MGFLKGCKKLIHKAPKSETVQVNGFFKGHFFRFLVKKCAVLGRFS